MTPGGCHESADGGEGAGRPDSQRDNSARIEAIFWPSGPTVDRVNAILDESGIEPEANAMVLVSRDFQDGGKSVARVNTAPCRCPC